MVEPPDEWHVAIEGRQFVLTRLPGYWRLPMREIEFAVLGYCVPGGSAFRWYAWVLPYACVVPLTREDLDQQERISPLEVLALAAR